MVFSSRLSLSLSVEAVGKPQKFEFSREKVLCFQGSNFSKETFSTASLAMKPSILRIIWTDWPALFATWGIPISWLIYFIFPYIRKGVKPHGLYLVAFAVSASAVFITMSAWRVIRIRRLFRLGEITKGRITALWFAKDRGRLEYAYEINGQRFNSWSPVHKTKSVLSLKVGEVVEILVDKKRPLRAIVKRLYVG